jgi:serine/threonine protein kinase
MSAKYVLLVASGDLRKEIPIGEEPLLVGRGPESGLRLPDDYCSRVHGRFVEREGVLFVEDVGARNGIFVNGERVLVDSKLTDSDEVRMGRTVITVRKGAGALVTKPVTTELSDTQTKEIGPEGIQFVDPAMELGFHLQKLVAVSGMGLLFEARDVKSQQRVAFKILRPDRATEANVARAVEEAKSLSSIHHENVVPILSTGRMKNGESFLVMDYVAGLTATQLGKAGRLGVAEALKIAAETCAALGAVHARGMVHRDVKPSNVMVEESTFRTVLIDFSLALTEAGGLAGAPAGTIIFCAPEQVQPQTPAESMHPAVDVYGLGGTLYYMLCGVHPFRGATTLEIQRRKLEGPIPQAREKQKHLLPGIDEIITACLRPQPSDRPQSILDVKREIDKVRARYPRPTFESGTKATLPSPVSARKRPLK